MTDNQFLQYKPMIYKIANKYKNNKYDITLDDLVQIGAIGLMNGINSYDSNNCKHSLTTHLYNNIRWEIQKELYKHIKKDKFTIVSIETPISDDITLADTLEDDIDLIKQVEDTLLLNEYIEECNKILSKEATKTIMDYAIYDKTVNDLAAEHNISNTEMSTLLSKYKQKLRRNIKFKNAYLEMMDTRLNSINYLCTSADKVVYDEMNILNKYNAYNKESVPDKIQMLLDRLSG